MGGPLGGPVDLVLGGGGVRGIAYVGALSALAAAGWTPFRVAGASAGAMAGALWVAGAQPDEMRGYLEELDYRSFAFADVVGRLTRRPVVGSVVERLSPSTTDPLVWYDSLLADHGVRTWADLRLDDDQAGHLPPERRYALVVRCLDVVKRRVVHLPWDYHRYGLEPDSQPVSEAVRASMSVPVVFDPVQLGEGDRAGLLVDGALGGGFPVSVFDRSDNQPPRRPTIAVRLVARSRSSGWPEGDMALVRAVVETMLEAGDQLELAGDCDERRTIRVDASSLATLDVRMTAQEEAALFDEGVRSTEAFLADYDHDAWTADCR